MKKLLLIMAKLLKEVVAKSLIVYPLRVPFALSFLSFFVYPWGVTVDLSFLSHQLQSFGQDFVSSLDY